MHRGKQAGASGTVSVGGGGNFISVKPTERVSLLGEIIFEVRQLWVRLWQALCSIVSVPSGIASVDEFPAQNAELGLKQVFLPQEKEKNSALVFFSPI